MVGLLTVEKQGKKNIFSGRILEIEGLSNITCEQAFEMSDASAERSAAGCTITVDPDMVHQTNTHKHINTNTITNLYKY